MRTTYRVLSVCALVALSLSGCGPSNGSSAPAPPTVAKVSSDVLEFAVGTANIYGDGGAGVATTGLNVVATYRQPNGGTLPGGSGTLVNSPTLTLPNTLAGPAGSPPSSGDATSSIDTGPASGEVGSDAMTSTSQVAGSSKVTTFGQSGGVFGLGIEPYNYDGVNLGQPASTAPYPVPLYDALVGTTAGDPNENPEGAGGPPSFDILGNGTSPTGDASVAAPLSLGIDVFEGVTPVAGGAYNLSLSIPANTGTSTKAASFSLPAALTTLPAFTAPIPTLDANGDGGATFAVTLPAGVTEAYVEVIDIGPVEPTATSAFVSCNGASAASPVFYTIELTASGTVTLGPAAGPGAMPSICTAAQNDALTGNATSTGDQFGVQGYGFDYPLYEASYTTGKIPDVPSPTILGANGEDDITISSLPVYYQATTGALTQEARHRAFVLRRGER